MTDAELADLGGTSIPFSLVSCLLVLAAVMLLLAALGCHALKLEGRYCKAYEEFVCEHQRCCREHGPEEKMV